MLDLDVGFLADPRGIVKTFNESPDIDIFVQVYSLSLPLTLPRPNPLTFDLFIYYF